MWIAAKKLLLFAGVFGIIASVYFGIAEYTLGRSAKTLFLLPIDAQIPFIPEAIFAYMSFHLFCFLPVFISSVSISKSIETIFAACIAFTIMFGFYLIVPSAYPRPEIQSCDSWSHALLAYYYVADPPNNTFPSSHVAITAILILQISPYLRRFYWFFVFWGASIIVSTLLVKQHYVVDVLSGITLAPISIWMARQVLAPKHQNTT